MDKVFKAIGLGLQALVVVSHWFDLTDTCRQTSGLPSVGELSKTGLPDRSRVTFSGVLVADVLQIIEVVFVDIKNFCVFDLWNFVG